MGSIWVQNGALHTDPPSSPVRLRKGALRSVICPSSRSTVAPSVVTNVFVAPVSTRQSIISRRTEATVFCTDVPALGGQAFSEIRRSHPITPGRQAHAEDEIVVGEDATQSGTAPGCSTNIWTFSTSLRRSFSRTSLSDFSSAPDAMPLPPKGSVLRKRTAPR